MRLKLLKEQPLLNLPGRGFGWAMLTDDDVKAMEHVVEENTSSRDALGVARSLFYRAGLGLPVEVKPVHVEIMSRELERGRKTNYGEVIAEMLFYGKKLGIFDGMGEGDGEAILKALEFRRIAGNGIEVAYLTYYLRGLGVNVKVTAKDLKTVREEIVEQRSSGPWRIATLYHCLAQVGLPQTIAAEDERILREHLADCRKRKNGYEIAEQIYCLSRILPPAESDQQPIPPIKRFGK